MRRLNRGARRARNGAFNGLMQTKEFNSAYANLENLISEYQNIDNPLSQLPRTQQIKKILDSITSQNLEVLTSIVNLESEILPGLLNQTQNFFPLHEAVKTMNLEVVQLLLKGGALPNATDSSKKTPLHYGFMNIDILKLLVSYGADPNLKDEEGFTAFGLASKAKLPLSVLREYVNLGADIHLYNQEGTCYVNYLDSQVLESLENLFTWSKSKAFLLISREVYNSLPKSLIREVVNFL